MSYTVIEKPQNQRFHFMQTLLYTNRIWSCCITNVLSIKHRHSNTENKTKQISAQNQKAGKCCVLPSAQKTGKCCVLSSAQKTGVICWAMNRTEIWRADRKVKTQMDSDTSLAWLAVILMPSLQPLF